MTFSNKTNKIDTIGFSHWKPILLVIPIFILLFVPSVSYANIFSLVSGVLSSQKVSAEAQVIIEPNSQNMDILEAPNTPDPSPKLALDIVVVGNEALLPETGPSTSAPEVIDNSGGQISVYIVRSGDTFSGIAKMFDVSVNTILWANDLNKNSVLKTGQTLVILPMSGVLHTVVSGDTLQGIAKKYGGDLGEIADFNGIKTGAKLTIGEKIMIPDGEASFSIRPSITSNTTARLVSGQSGPEYSGYYQKPFSVGIKTQGIHGYNAVDYGMPIGTPLYAAAAGTVIISKDSGYNGGYGKYVAIQHSNGTQTIYGHMNTISVSVGQNVAKGQSIGTSGNTGRSTGPHLHFEIRGAKNPF